MKFVLFYAAASYSIAFGGVEATIEDTFSFRDTNWTTRDFGPKNWNLVTCNNVTTCPGWPTNWEKFNSFISYEGSSNMCRDCSLSITGDCQMHQQSPIPLSRNVTGDSECYDRHKMHQIKGTCRWDDMNFTILPHVLRAYQPDFCEIHPAIDFSWGFPKFWLLKFTDFVVPSHHTQEGKQFPAEVILSHVYSRNCYDKEIANVAILLEKGTDEDRFDFLDLYINRFAQVARKVENKCAKNRRMMRSIEADADDFGGNYANGPIFQSPRALPQTLPMDYIKSKFYKGYFNPYLWVNKSGTEYYFRYNGSMPEPPCYVGVHWRVMKDPIRVSPQQITQLENLFLRRLNPNTCLPDTAGKPRDNGSGKLDFNRPLQTVRNQHKLVFCECVDWRSEVLNDKAYCNLTMEQRGVVNRTWPTITPTAPIYSTGAPSASL